MRFQRPRLAPFEWKTLAVALAALPLIDVSLRLWGYQRTRSWLQRRIVILSTRTDPPDADAIAAQVSRAVSIAACRGPWPASCLRQALLVEHLLQRRGISTELMIGVRGNEVTGIGAHAWVERNGKVIIGGEEASQNHRRML